jgi:hypothetical protein
LGATTHGTLQEPKIGQQFVSTGNSLLTVKSPCHVLCERDKQETEIGTQPKNCTLDIGKHHKLSNEFIKTVSSNLACFFHHLEREMIIHNCNC